MGDSVSMVGLSTPGLRMSLLSPLHFKIPSWRLQELGPAPPASEFWYFDFEYTFSFHVLFLFRRFFFARFESGRRIDPMFRLL